MTATERLRKVRVAVADYMRSEGCSCCGDYDQHAKDQIELGKLLRAKKYSDGSGYDFSRWRSKR